MLNSTPLRTGPSSHECKIPHEHLRRLRLTSTTLTTHQYGLAPVIIDQRPEIVATKNKEEDADQTSDREVLLSTDSDCSNRTHRPVTGICDRKEMGAELPKGGALVLLHHVHVIEMRQPLERVLRNQDVPGVGLSGCLTLSAR